MSQSQTATCTAALALLLLATPVLAQDQKPQLTNNCPGEKLDRTTMADARQRAEKAGYAKVTGLRKGCDSIWHGKAEKAGASVFIMVTPSGEVAVETE